MAVDVGSVQHAARSVLSQRSVNVLHVNKSPSASDHKVGDAKPTVKPSASMVF